MQISIGQRLGITFIGLAVVPLLLVGIIIGLLSYSTEQRQAFIIQTKIAQGIAIEVKSFFKELENQLRLISKAQVLKGLDRNARRNILKLLLFNNLFEEIILIDQKGREQIHLSRLRMSSTVADSHAAKQAFIQPLTQKKTYFSPVRFSAANGEPFMTIAVPLKDIRSNSVTGVLNADVRLKKVWNLIAELSLSKGQTVYILDKQNRVVAHSNPSVVLRGTSFEVPEEGGIKTGLNGKDCVLAAALARFGDKTFTVVAEQTISEALFLAINTVRITAVLVMAVLIIACILGYLAVRQIVQPIKTMAATAAAISDGDLSRQVIIRREDELGVLASAFNAMTKRLRSLVDNLEQRVTERTSQLEAAQAKLLRKERLATLGKLTATVSHEIRNPLAAIRTSAFVVGLKTQNQGLTVENALERIERNVVRCDTVIAELLDYTSMPDLSLQPVSFDHWLDQLLTGLTVPEGITMACELTADVSVLLDPERFRRVIINLFNNACQAMQEWKPSHDHSLILKIRSEVIEEQLKLSISDTGPGIAPDLMLRIFDPLYSTKGFGTGLGLPIAKEIVTQHKGNLEIFSDKNSGTQAILWLPLPVMKI